MTLFQLFDVHNRQCEPVAQQTRAHRTGGLVDDVDEADSVLPGSASENFEITVGELVHPYEPLTVDAGDGADVAQSAVLRLFKVYQQCSGRCHTEREIVDRKTFERIDFQLFLKFLDRVVINESPLLKRGDVVFSVGFFLYPLFITLRHKQFLRAE